MGADMAAGSHEENGIWALLVIKVITIKLEIIKKKKLFSKNFQSKINDKQQIDRKKKTSPNRLTKKVNIPATDLL